MAEELTRLNQLRLIALQLELKKEVRNSVKMLRNYMERKEETLGSENGYKEDRN